MIDTNSPGCMYLCTCKHLKKNQTSLKTAAVGKESYRESTCTLFRLVAILLVKAKAKEKVKVKKKVRRLYNVSLGRQVNDVLVDSLVPTYLMYLNVL